MFDKQPNALYIINYMLHVIRPNKVCTSFVRLGFNLSIFSPENKIRLLGEF